MKKIFLFIFLLILVVSSVSAATIHGTVYDMNLDAAKGAVVEVNSVPKQRIAAVDGEYSFDLSKGVYTITAKYNGDSTYQTITENITILYEGEYILDLFLFVDISSENELYDSTNIDFSVPYTVKIMPYVLSVILFFLIIGFIIFWIRYNRRKSNNIMIKKDDKDLDKVMQILKKHSGRLTQKEIRREIPLSEAKISLMISELESDGKVRRIRKGRSNIIVLQ